MSGGEYVEITLDEVIKQSDVIAIVKSSRPASVVEEVLIHKDQQKFPSFKRYISLFEVVDILYKNDNVASLENVILSNGIIIKVLPAAYNKELDLHRRYYLEGDTKTIGINKYKDYDNKFKKLKEWIVFLRYNAQEKMLEFTALDAVEALEKKNKIIVLSAQVKK